MKTPLGPKKQISTKRIGRFWSLFGMDLDVIPPPNILINLGFIIHYWARLTILQPLEWRLERVTYDT